MIYVHNIYTFSQLFHFPFFVGDAVYLFLGKPHELRNIRTLRMLEGNPVASRLWFSLKMM